MPPQQPGQAPYVPLPPVQQPLWQGQQAPIEGQPWPSQPPVAPRRRRPWFLPAVALGVLLLVALGVVLAVVLTRDDAPEPLRVADLEVGDCIASEAIAQGDLAVDDLSVVSCSAAHHGEVYATFDASDDALDLDAAGRLCSTELTASGRSLAEVTAAGQELRPLAADDDLRAGTAVVCFLRNSDGSPLTGSPARDTDSSTTPSSTNPTSTEE
ncbi:hypothetical protein [Nocardioides dubius]|uniref:hypothetical protein n=1 Tax=Nocardioides dubius TaxID=317019 RepID=UPI0031DCC523